MNTEHTKHPCETVDASADVMKLAGMILSDCGCSTAISDRLQRRVAGRIQLHMDSVAQQLELERGSLFAESQRKQQLQGQVDALMEAMAKISRMTMSMYTSAGEAMRDAKRISHEAIAAAEQTTLCGSCARADVNCPIYPQQTASCVEHRPAAQQQAEPVALIMCDGKSYDFMVTVEGQKRIPDTGEFVHLYAAQPPAVAVPDERAAFEAWLQENIDDTDTVRPSKEKVDAYFAVWLARAMLAAAPQGADPIKRLIAMHNELLGEYPYCYFELAYTRRTDWMAWLCTKPREDDPERKVLACGQGLTAEEACAEAISAAQKGGAA